MIQTTTKRFEAEPKPATGSGIRVQLSDILINFIAGILAPMFLCVTGGDISTPRPNTV